jgi:hypothetical protein
MGAKVQSCAITGLQGTLIEVEVDIADGCAALTLVCLSLAAGSVLKERVCSAITSSGYSFPHKQIMVKLAPVDLRKEGLTYDLPIATGILLASVRSILPYNKPVFFFWESFPRMGACAIAPVSCRWWPRLRSSR